MRFEFLTPARIVFGTGAIENLGTICREFGTRPLLVAGRDPARSSAAVQSLEKAGLRPVLFHTQGEPTTDSAQNAAQTARDNTCDVVIGLGGGSALDTAKAAAALAPNPGDIYDYLEVVGRAQPLARPSLPCIAVPTTAGSGAEVTRNAVLASTKHHVKISMRGPYLTPRVALIDPALTLALPPAATAFTGLDALTQLIEPYVSSRANPMTDALCLEGMRRVAASLRTVFHDGQNMAAREGMSVASLFGGLALANAGLGAVHGFAGPIGGMFDAPHGAVCAALLPCVMKANLNALRQRAPALEKRFQTVAQTLTGNPAATADEGVRWVRELVNDLQIPALRAYGIQPGDIPALVQNAAKSSSMKANPLVLDAVELTAVLEEAV
jgi:alcohol dehydrogenase class IV